LDHVPWALREREEGGEREREREEQGVARWHAPHHHVYLEASATDVIDGRSEEIS
jgi:hypothetical protein